MKKTESSKTKRMSYISPLSPEATKDHSGIHTCDVVISRIYTYLYVILYYKGNFTVDVDKRSVKTLHPAVSQSRVDELVKVVHYR